MGREIHRPVKVRSPFRTETRRLEFFRGKVSVKPTPPLPLRNLNELVRSSRSCRLVTSTRGPTTGPAPDPGEQGALQK
jgi:hypothetical protein